MSSVSVRDSRLPTLSSPNLRKLGSSKLDKDRFLRSYIRSQEAHLSSYVLEGKSVAASWNAEKTNVPPKKIARDVELESGFGTPMLKPRASITRVSNVQTQDVQQHCGRAREKDGKEDERRGSSASGGMAEEDMAARGERDVGDSRGAKRARRKEEKSTSTRKERVPAGSKPKEQRSRKPPVQGRGRDPDSEEERCNRLAERRERRRTKKAIVYPKHGAPASVASSNESDDGRERKKSRGKKGKGPSMPAGLALMHGFSATNICKNRLTLEPTIGVFNKGKASARMKVKKPKEKGPKTKMFSENWFLGKTKAVNQKAASTSSQSRGSDQLREHQSESSSDSAPERPQGKAKSSKRKAQNYERARSPSTVGASPDECEEAAPRHEGRLTKKRKSERAESPVWDIELEDGQLPSNSHSDGHAPSETGTKVAGTLLLDTHAFSSRWAIPEVKHDSPPTGQTIEMTERAAEPQDDHQLDGASTIDPSHSASQVAYRGMAFSRFFPRPSGTQGESVARKDTICHNNAAMPAVQPASHQKNPSDDPDGTVQNRMVRPACDLSNDSLASLHQDRAEPLPSPLRAPAESPSVRNKSSFLVVARPPSSAPSSNLLQEVLSGAPPADVGASHGAHPEYASSMSLNTPQSPLPPPIPMGGIEATDFEDQDVTSSHDWTTEFLGLLGDEAPTDLFLSNAAGREDSAEQPNGDDIYLEPYVGLAEEELPAFLDIDTWELEGEDTRGAGGGSYLVEEEQYELDSLQEYPPEHYGSTLIPSWEDTPEEFGDVPYPRRKRVKFSDDVVCYEDDREIYVDNAEPGEVWKWQAEPDINDAEHDALGEDGFSEFGDPDDRSAGAADPDPTFLDADCQLDLSVAAEDESSQLEEDEGGVPSEMELGDERSVLGSLQRFSQGRALLLMGVALEIGLDSFGTRLGVSTAEEDVARNLHGHWRPQRF